jgi:hypothetical protein
MSGTVAMRRQDGAIDSELHLDGLVVKADDTGLVRIPSQFVLSLMNAGYVWAEDLMRNPARTNS